MAIITNKINKKVRGATITTITNSDGSTITFKSKLEATIYKALLELQEEDSNIQDIQYEPIKYIIWRGIKPALPYYVKDKHTKHLKDENAKLRDLSYTPDIVFYYKNNIVLVEVKPTGMENDTFPIKEKMFRKYLEESHQEDSQYYPIYCKLSSKKDLIELIDIIKEKYV